MILVFADIWCGLERLGHPSQGSSRRPVQWAGRTKTGHPSRENGQNTPLWHVSVRLSGTFHVHNVELCGAAARGAVLTWSTQTAACVNQARSACIMHLPLLVCNDSCVCLPSHEGSILGQPCCRRNTTGRSQKRVTPSCRIVMVDTAGGERLALQRSNVPKSPLCDHQDVWSTL